MKTAQKTYHESCACHHNEHSDCHCGEHMELSSKTMIIRLISGVILAGLGFFVSGYAKVFLFAAAYIIFAYDVLFTAAKNILRGKIFDENFLMAIASLGAFVLRDYPEAAAVMLLYQIGELLTHNATEKSKSSIKALMDVRPDTARVIENGSSVIIPCTEIKPGQRVAVAAGERIPVDGIISKGAAMLDTSSLTGESEPRPAGEGDRVLAGMISTDGSLEITAEKEFGESTLSRILELAQNAQEKKTKTERFITSFAKVYTPAVVAAAVIVAVLPPILGLGGFMQWIERALTFLVISCPCALVISVPLTFFAGIGCASKHGVLIKNSKAIENLAKSSVAAFDKTGTLTDGKLYVTEIRPIKGSKSELLELAAYAEADSTHPAAMAVKTAFSAPIDRQRIEQITEISARGISAHIDGKHILAGSEKLLEEQGIIIGDTPSKSAIYIAKDGDYIGYIGYADKIKDDSLTAVSQLKNLGFKTAILSGDNRTNAERIASAVGISSIYSELLPQDKAKILSDFSNDGITLFAGDGINDAVSLASADVGVAMGGIGSDAAIESADVVIMGDKPSKIPLAVRISRKVMNIARQNIIFSVGVKLAIMFLSLFGIGGMWPAIFADVGVCLIAVANALRAYRLN